jgi:hypothetical protein
MPLSDDAQARALAVLERYHDHPVQLDLDVQQLTMLVGALQLALRHPHFPATSRRFLEGWLENVITTTGRLSPHLEDLLLAGNDPAQDVPVDAKPPRPGPAPSLEILIQPTDQLTHLDGVLCRVWPGVTDEGVPCVVFVRRVAVAEGEDSAAFDAAVQAQLPPGRVVELRTVLERRDTHAV